MQSRCMYVLATLALCAPVAALFGCGDVLIQALDKSMINARSMEFAKPLFSTLLGSGRGEMIQSEAPGGRKGLSWTSKYGYVGIDCLGINAPSDGMNEKGLSIGGLWLPTTEYQQVTSEQEDKALSLELFGAWVLGNFATIEEVKAALPQVIVWAKSVPQMGMVPPLHFAMHDVTGKSLVVEFLNGEQKVYDNPIAVLTNYPPFAWHRDNLRNYTKLVPSTNGAPVDFQGETLQFYGHGNGLLGLPGDWMPASRFVRLAYIRQCAKTPKTAIEAVNVAEHLFNTVDIPIGPVLGDKPDDADFTQWLVIKDLTNKKLYFRTYDNQALRLVDLKQLNFSKGAKFKPVAMATPSRPVDVTKSLR